MLGRLLHFLLALVTASLLLCWWLTIPNRRAFWLPELFAWLFAPQRKK